MKACFSRSRIISTVVGIVVAVGVAGASSAQQPCLDLIGADPHGPIRTASMENHLLVYGNGRVLTIADLSDPAAPIVLGEVVFESRIQTIATTDTLAVAILKYSGVAIVDISDPSSPSPVGFVPLLNRSDQAKIIIDDAFVYTSTDAALATIISIRDPSSPEVVATVGSIGLPAAGFEIGHETLYIMANGGITTYLIADPTDPVEVATFPVTGFSMAMEWPLVYVTYRGAVRVFRSAQPYFFTELNPIELVDWPNDSLGWVVVEDATAAVSARVDDEESIFVLDLGLPDPAAGAVTISAISNLIFLDLRGSNLIQASDPVGLTITDLSDPVNPVVTTSIIAPGAAMQVAVVGDRALVQSGFGDYNYSESSGVWSPSFGLRMLDVADPSAPVEMDRIFVELGLAPDLPIENGLAYLPAPFTIVDVSDPHSLQVVGSDQSNTYGISKRGSLVYGSTWDDVILIVDVSNPTNPVTVNVPIGVPPFEVFDVAMTPGYGYAVGWAEPTIGAFAVLDLTNPLLVSVVASIELPFEPVELEIDGERAFVRAGWEIVEIDISDPLFPTVLSQDFWGTNEGDFEISGDVLYNAVGSMVQVINIREPGHPQLECELQTTEFIRGIAVSGGEVYLAHDTNGLSIYRQYGGALFLDGFEVGTTENWDPME
jgi:hypothetical protein